MHWFTGLSGQKWESSCLSYRVMPKTFAEGYYISGWWFQPTIPLKNITVSWDDEIPN